MSGYERAFRRRQRREMVALAIANARAEGCTCTPDVSLPLDAGPGKVRVVTIAHDWDCPRAVPEHGNAAWQALKDEINGGRWDGA